MQKRVLVFSAGHSEEGFISALKELGCYVITTGNRPEQEGHRLADEYIYGDYNDLDLMYDIATRLKVDAVFPSSGDGSIIASAYIAEKLGLPGHDSYEATMILHNKDRFKAFAAKLGGVRTPQSVPFTACQQALDWAANEAHEYPLIVKPADQSTGVGVRRVDTLEELQSAICFAFDESRNGRVLIEPFLEGEEESILAFLVDRKVIMSCSTGEHMVTDPYLVEVATLPAAHIDLVQEDLIEQIERIANALDLTDGLFHVQYIFNSGKAHILECMRRVIGNKYCALAEKATPGFRWEYWQARAKCGFGCEGIPTNVPQSGFWAFRKLLAEENGVFDRIEFPAGIREHIFWERIMHEPGYIVSDHRMDLMALFFMQFSSREEMMEMLINRAAEFKVLLK